MPVRGMWHGKSFQVFPSTGRGLAFSLSSGFQGGHVSCLHITRDHSGSWGQETCFFVPPIVGPKGFSPRGALTFQRHKRDPDAMTLHP